MLIFLDPKIAYLFCCLSYLDKNWSKGCVPLCRAYPELSDLVPVIIVKVIKDIIWILFYNRKISLVKVLDYFAKKFSFANCYLYIFYNLYYDYWDQITQFWPGSTKWNISSKCFLHITIFILSLKIFYFAYKIYTMLPHFCGF